MLVDSGHCRDQVMANFDHAKAARGDDDLDRGIGTLGFLERR